MKTFAERLRELDEASTPGPWFAIKRADGLVDISAGEIGLIASVSRWNHGRMDQCQTVEDANFIAFFRNASAELLAVLEAQKKRIQIQGEWQLLCRICSYWTTEGQPERHSETCALAALNAKVQP